MRARPALLAAVVAALLVSCAPRASSGNEGLHILAAETFLADIAQNVAGNRLVVQSLLKPGVDPHEFQATPQDAIRIAQADVLIVNGLGYEVWLEKTLQARPDQQIVRASDGLQAGPAGNPHVWMNPQNVVRYVENIRDALSRVDPQGSSVYDANAAAYMRELEDLDAWIKTAVAKVPADKRVLITNHQALEAFADAYGFEIAGVVIPGVTSEAAPSAQQMAELIRTVESRHAPAIFLDVSENPNLAEQVAQETGAKVVTGLYVETLSDPRGPAPTYLDMMKYDAQLIVDSLM